MNTSVTLIVNGEIRDYHSHMKEVVKDALKELLPTMQINSTAESDFKIMPQMSYRISDTRIIELFGCQNIEKNPAQAIINRLRSVGIEPQKRGRSGSVVFGHQILQYLEEAERKTKPFLSR